MCDFAAILFLLIVVRFSLVERKNEQQMKWEAPAAAGNRVFENATE
jgi:hypothetical protein